MGPKGCKDTDLVTFGWDVPTAAPTPGPAAVHNPASCSPSVDPPSTPTPPTNPTNSPTSNIVVPTNAPTPTLAPAVHNPASCSPSAESGGIVTLAPVPPAIDNTCGEDGATSLLDYLCQVENFGLACQAFTKAGQSDLLGGITVPAKDAQLTVFAPINDAMLAAGYTSDYIEQEMDVTQFAILMCAQILRGRYTVEELVCDEHYVTILGVASVKIECITNADGSITKTEGGFYNHGPNPPEILPPKDVSLCNGLVQPISQVIFVTSP